MLEAEIAERADIAEILLWPINDSINKKNRTEGGIKVSREMA